VNLGSSRRLLTVLFCDIRNFTPLSERLEPEVVAERSWGRIPDRPDRGRLQAWWNRGQNTLVIASWRSTTSRLNIPNTRSRRCAPRSRFRLIPGPCPRSGGPGLAWNLSMGSGSAPGRAIVGTLGSRQRLEYTAIGDTVNLAARLETLTKEFEAPIIVSESTQSLLNDEFSLRPLGNVTIKGKEKAVNIYAVLSSHIQS